MSRPEENIAFRDLDFGDLGELDFWRQRFPNFEPAKSWTSGS